MIPKLKDSRNSEIFAGNGNLGVSAVLRNESNSCDDCARALSATEKGENQPEDDRSPAGKIAGNGGQFGLACVIWFGMILCLPFGGWMQ